MRLADEALRCADYQSVAGVSGDVLVRLGGGCGGARRVPARAEFANNQRERELLCSRAVRFVDG